MFYKVSACVYASKGIYNPTYNIALNISAGTL